jgi:sec-independent protein translocase protein TatB
MFGIGFQELLLILALVLIVIGPKRLPEVAKMLGKAALEFKKATDELKNSVQVDLRTDDDLKTLRDQYRQVMEIPTTAAAAVQSIVNPPQPPSPYPGESPEPVADAPGTAASEAPQAAPGETPETTAAADPQPSYRRNEVEG